MSRSYKKYPLCRCERRFDNKNYKNRQLRRNHKYDPIPDGASYKRLHNIPSEWSYYWSKEQAIQDYYRDERIQRHYTIEEWLQYWQSCVRRK